MRVKRGTSHVKRRKNILKKTKGYRWGRKNLIKKAKEAALHAGAHAYRGRKQKKRDNRTIWSVSINAAVREHGMSYSRFIDALKKHKVDLNRKALSEIARNYPAAFKKIVESVK